MASWNPDGMEWGWEDMRGHRARSSRGGTKARASRIGRSTRSAAVDGRSGSSMASKERSGDVTSGGARAVAAACGLRLREKRGVQAVGAVSVRASLPAAGASRSW
jgi:hypothetical protein